MFKRSKLVLCSIALAVSAVPAAADAQSTTFWQCVTFARMYSGIQLFGNAATWWNQAVGKYTRGNAPQAGAVLVFKAIGSMRAGHVATVSQVVSDRIIKVTHANWSSRGEDQKGQPISAASGADERADLIAASALISLASIAGAVTADAVASPLGALPP